MSTPPKNLSEFPTPQAFHQFSGESPVSRTRYAWIPAGKWNTLAAEACYLVTSNIYALPLSSFWPWALSQWLGRKTDRLVSLSCPARCGYRILSPIGFLLPASAAYACRGSVWWFVLAPSWTEMGSGGNEPDDGKRGQRIQRQKTPLNIPVQYRAHSAHRSFQSTVSIATRSLD